MKKIPLTRGQTALVDDEDFERVSAYHWHASKKSTERTWYARAHVALKGRPKATVLMHRFILNEFDPQILIDHRDRNGLNNCKSNLRRATKSQNLVNSPKQGRNKSKYKGVYPSRTKWRARLRANGHDVHIGVFSSEHEAAKAYNEEVKARYGEFAMLNEILVP